MADFTGTPETAAAAAVLADDLSRMPVAQGGPRGMGLGSLAFEATVDAIRRSGVAVPAQPPV